MKKAIALTLAATCIAGALSSCRSAEEEEESSNGDDVKQTTQTADQTTEVSEGTEDPTDPKETDATQPPAAIPSVVTDEQGLTYINGILVVNKTYALPSTYDPGVDSEAYAALQEMFQGAAAEGISLEIVSGYRSFNRQSTLYNNYVARDGVEAADTYSARAGHSEHQTGLAFDLNSLEESFGETREGIWLKEHCWEYGFIIRYPQGKESVTGYMYEPWHVRYLGKTVAKSVFDSGLCLEEYLNVTSVYAE